MISETSFASNYASVWRSLAPTMEDFVRRWNLDGYERYWAPFQSTTKAERRGVLNEAAFRLFVERFNKPKPISVDTLKKLARKKINEAQALINPLVHGKAFRAAGNDIEDVVSIANRLIVYCQGKVVSTCPAFDGCGLLACCEGDILVDGNVLVEVKAGERPFRSVDYRQLAIYTALRFAAGHGYFERLVLLNPRTGLSVDVRFETFVSEIGGQNPIQFCQSLIDSMAENLVSN